MRRLFALLAVTALTAVACSDDVDTAADPVDPTTTTEPTTNAAPTTTIAAPSTYCEGVEQVNASLDEIARTMLATLSGEPSGQFILAVDDTIELLGQTAELAPPEAADATTLLFDTYAGFEELLFEIDFVAAEIPTDDPRAAALSSADFTDAVATMTEACR
ncbi:MAG: hypothetical protein AAF081_14380 [Actinomycetota bacterium]